MRRQVIAIVAGLVSASSSGAQTSVALHAVTSQRDARITAREMDSLEFMLRAPTAASGNAYTITSATRLSGMMALTETPVSGTPLASDVEALQRAVTAIKNAPLRKRRSVKSLRELPEVRAVLGGAGVSPQSRDALSAAIEGTARVSDSLACEAAPKPSWALMSSQLAYNFAGNNSLDDNLGIALQGTLQSWAPKVPCVVNRHSGLGGWGVDIIGNLARPNPASTKDELKQQAENLLNSSDGIQAGLMPMVFWGKGASGYSATVYGVAAVRTNAAKDSQDSVVYLEQRRLAAGVMFGIGDFAIGKEPGRLAIEPFRIRFTDPDRYARVFGEKKRNYSGWDISLLVPMGNEVGLLAHYIVSRTSGVHDVYRGGLYFKPADKEQK